MEFSFMVPVPTSWNAMYRVAKVNIRDRYGQPMLNDAGGKKQRMGLIKTRAASDYQEQVGLVVRAARPSGWVAPAELLIGYRFYLKRMTDVDNLEKALNDAIARSLGVNDSTFLPIPLHRESRNKDPRVIVELWDAAKYQAAIVPR